MKVVRVSERVDKIRILMVIDIDSQCHVQNDENIKRWIDKVVKLVRTLMFSILLYTSETRTSVQMLWCWKKSPQNTDDTGRKDLMHLCCKKKKKQIAIQKRLFSLLLTRKMKYFGHFMRRKKSDGTQSKVEGARSRGRPPTR